MSYTSFGQDTNKNKGLSGSVEFRYLSTYNVSVEQTRGVNFDDMFGKSLRFGLGYFFNPHVYGGLSFGADRYEDAFLPANTFPVTLQGKYYLKDKRNTPYAYGEFGPSISFSDASDKGVSGGIGVGYKFFATKRMCLAGTLGYNYQKSNEATSFGESTTRQSLVFGIGFHF